MAEREWVNSSVSTGLVGERERLGCRAALVKGISQRGGPGMVLREGTEVMIVFND